MQWFLYLFGALFGLGGLQYLIVAPQAQGFVNGKSVIVYGVGSRVLGVFYLLSAASFVRGGMVAASSDEVAGLVWIAPAFVLLIAGMFVAPMFNALSRKRPSDTPDWKPMAVERVERPDYDDADYDDDN